MTTTTAAPATTIPAEHTLDLAAQGTWRGKFNTDIRSGRFTYATAEPEAIGGTDESPSPMDLVLGATSGCISVVVELVAKELGITVDALDIDVSGQIDIRGFLGTADVPPHFQAIQVTVRLVTDAPVEKVEQLKAAVAPRCPALGLFRAAQTAITEEWIVTAA